ncbi:MAG TPA: PAS domain S-box protein, partial [Azospira sp.]|nr:PAS domain S-box protein [Azospira sp.]
MIVRNRMAVAVAAAGLVLAAAFLGYSAAQSFALNALRVEARYRLDLLSGAIDAEVSRLSNIPGVVAVNSTVLELLRSPRGNAKEAEASVNRFLAQVSAQHVDSLAIFVMDTAGRVVASSDSIYTNNLLHADLSHLQFFRSGLVGAPARQYTVDAVHDESGHFFALPIRDESQEWRIVGVAVVKASMRGIERRWLVSNEPALVAGDDGVVLQAWPRDWRFATLGKVSEEGMRELALQRYLGRETGGVIFSLDLANPEEGSVITLPDHVELPERMAGKGREFFVVSRKQVGSPWSLVVFQSVKSMRVLAVGGGALAAAMMLSVVLGGLYLWQRHRTMAARLVAQARLEAANRKLEVKVRKRTEQLTHTVDKLKEEVSQRERAEEFLRASEQRFRALFEFSPDPCWFIEGKRFVSCNFAAVDILGYETRADLLAVHPTQISPEFQSDGRVSVEKAMEMINLAYEKGVLRFEWEYRRRDGSRLPVEVTLTRIAIFGPGVLYCMWRDISERKETERALVSANRRYETLNAELEVRVADRTRLLEAEIQERRAAEAAVLNSERWLREIIDTISSGILLWNGERRLVAWNHAFEQMFPALMRHIAPGIFCGELPSLLERGGVVGLLDTKTDDWNCFGRWECDLADGRVVAVERLATSDGGRLMQFADMTVQVRTADALARNERMASL